MKRNVIVIGASGHGKVVADIVRASGDNFIGFLDDNPNVKKLGEISDYKNYSNAEFIVAIGDAQLREHIVSYINVNWYTAIHPTSVISSSASIGEGTVVMANAVINADAIIGKHCIINTSSVVEHDCILENYVHISVAAKLGGNVKIGKSTWVGIGATINNNIDICEECLIGAGAVVVSNIFTSGTYVGVPANILIK